MSNTFSTDKEYFRGMRALEKKISLPSVDMRYIKMHLYQMRQMRFLCDVHLRSH